MDAQTVRKNVEEISARFAQERRVRQRRRKMYQADFDHLREAGFLHTVVPMDQGGLWENVERSTRPICELLRTLAQGDPSIALVASMHPAVLVSVGWLTLPTAPPPFQQAWETPNGAGCSRRHVRVTGGGPLIRNLVWWRCLEDKSGCPPWPHPGTYVLTGQKHFGSGSGITSFMHTVAVVQGQTEPDTFFMDMRGVPWDGSAGVTLVAEWDGCGMAATQSHALAFQDVPATRLAWPEARRGAPAGRR